MLLLRQNDKIIGQVKHASRKSVLVRLDRLIASLWRHAAHQAIGVPKPANREPRREQPSGPIRKNSWKNWLNAFAFAELRSV